MIASVPREMNLDHTSVLREAEQAGGHISSPELLSNLGWNTTRLDQAVQYLLKARAHTFRWVPAIFVLLLSHIIYSGLFSRCIFISVVVA